MRIKQAIFWCSFSFVIAVPAYLQSRSPGWHWVGTWAASQQIPEPRNTLPVDDLHDATLRQIVHLSIGGRTLRLHVTNAFGTAPLHLSAVHIARPVSTSEARIEARSDHALTFSGRPDVTIPAGAEYISDPADFPVPAGGDIAVSIHFDGAPAQQTGHPGSRATSYLIPGDFVSATEMPGSKRIDHWYQVAGIDVATPLNVSAIVALGDSITDGRGASTNGNDRWTDVLARRLQGLPASRASSVLNLGTGGNHLLTDGLGPNVLARFDRDVLAQSGVRYLIVLEGINDLGELSRAGDAPTETHALLVHTIIAAYEQIILRARSHGIKVIGATILPYTGSNYYHPAPANESDRATVNQWIRGAGHFDAVLDFDEVMRDPAHPERLNPAFDSGDHLHPSPAGYAAMASSIPLELFH